MKPGAVTDIRAQARADLNAWARSEKGKDYFDALAFASLIQAADEGTLKRTETGALLFPMYRERPKGERP